MGALCGSASNTESFQFRITKFICIVCLFILLFTQTLFPIYLPSYLSCKPCNGLHFTLLYVSYYSTILSHDRFSVLPFGTFIFVYFHGNVPLAILAFPSLNQSYIALEHHLVSLPCMKAVSVSLNIISVYCNSKYAKVYKSYQL